jgi:hypothetical protein
MCVSRQIPGAHVSLPGQRSRVSSGLSLSPPAISGHHDATIAYLIYTGPGRLHAALRRGYLTARTVEARVPNEST